MARPDFVARYAPPESSIAAQTWDEAEKWLTLADALAAAVAADRGEPDPACAVCQAADAYRAARRI